LLPLRSLTLIHLLFIPLALARLLPVTSPALSRFVHVRRLVYSSPPIRRRRPS